MDNISGSHPLRLEALVLAGGDEQLIRKLNALLAKVSLHGGEQELLRRLLERARS